MNDLPLPIVVSERIRHALDSGAPVVALESTLIAQGLPWPQNLQTAHAAEQAVREQGAEPATIAVIGGTIQVGLDPPSIERMAHAGGFVKASVRDLSLAVSANRDAATTVAATLWIAQRAGIGVMATGGLGGVHRGAETTFDISADLDALARAHGMAIICSGVKSILDIPATLEALETRGITLLGYQTHDFPAFTSVRSGLELEHRRDTPEDVARVVQAHRTLGLPGAVVIAQPVAPDVAIPDQQQDDTLRQALDLCARKGVTGKAVTPFLLDFIREATEGASLRANMALIVANAALAGQIATALSPSNPD